MSFNYRSEAGREKLINQMTSYLRSLANRRSSGVVSADDAHNYLTRAGIREQMVRTRLSFINSVFSNGEFEAVGSAPSSRPQARGRAITTWTTA